MDDDHGNDDAYMFMYFLDNFYSKKHKFNVLQLKNNFIMEAGDFCL